MAYITDILDNLAMSRTIFICAQYMIWQATIMIYMKGLSGTNSEPAGSITQSMLWVIGHIFQQKAWKTEKSRHFHGTDIHDFCKVQPDYTVENMMSHFTITAQNKHDTRGRPSGPLKLFPTICSSTQQTHRGESSHGYWRNSETQQIDWNVRVVFFFYFSLHVFF